MVKRSFLLLTFVILSLMLPKINFAQFRLNDTKINLVLNSKTTIYWAKYSSHDKNFNWDGGIKVWLDILESNHTYLYFFGDIETIIKRSNNVSKFDPQKVHYTLKPGLKLKSKWANLEIIWDHHCKHDVDRFDGVTEKWNVLATEFSKAKQLKGVMSIDGQFLFGKIVEKNDVDYDWEIIIDFDIYSFEKKLFPFCTANLRTVITDGSRSTRNHFFDYTFEAGVKQHVGYGFLVGYIQFLHLNDTDHCGGKIQNMGKLGVRFELK